MARLLPFFLCCSVARIVAQDVPVIPFGSTWKYRDNGTDQGTAWRTPAFDDSGWSSGPAELGYGDGDESTLVSYGPSTTAKYITTYFRKTFFLPNVNAYPGYALHVKRDAGFVLYINGVEAMRQNFDQAAVSYTRLAYSAVANSEEPKLLDEILTPSQFINGNNTIAVEMHLNNATSADMSFDLELVGLDAVPGIFRGPYLHAATSSGITVCWRTDVPTDSRVRYGMMPGALVNIATNASPALEHEIKITGLQPNTTYYYAIGTQANDLAGDDSTFFFRTHPPIGSSSPVRIWAIGDAGSGYSFQQNVRNAYLDLAGSSHKADVWLMLGDNAYWHGRESEHQIGVFRDMYEGILRNTVLWPIPGNHDYYSGANGLTNTGPYYRIFSMPKLGEAGGVASNSEAYYSFEVGNVHFIALDSYGVSRSTTGPMATWLTADITQAQASSKWIIVYWHHPPYTKGSHNSDTPGDSGGIMFDMRQRFAPIIEAHGADLVLSGHSHVYERSFLINGHYGVSSTFNEATMKLDGNSGQADGTGPYVKPGIITPNMGTVYVVCGVSGKHDISGSLNHPAMYYSTNAQLGSMVIDVTGSTLSAKFLNDQGIVVDHFDIRKNFGPVRVAAKVFLEGPWDINAGMMRDDLRQAGLLPTTQPFTGVFAHVGEASTQTLSPAVLSVTGNNAIVDWIFVEVRDKSEPDRVVAAKAALMQRDGDVVDTDGTSPVAFNLPDGEYHVALRHRNHLGVMTGGPLPLTSSTTAPIDLTSSSVTTHGTGARKDINGTLVMWSGDAMRDGVLKYTGSDNDRDPILVIVGGTTPNNGVPGYHTEDTNMDGIVKYTGSGNDRDVILVNVGSTTPNNLRIEQLP